MNEDYPINQPFEEEKYPEATVTAISEADYQSEFEEMKKSIRQASDGNFSIVELVSETLDVRFRFDLEKGEAFGYSDVSNLSRQSMKRLDTFFSDLEDWYVQNFLE